MKRLAALLLLLLPFCCAAQEKAGQARLDSLLAELPNMKEDTNGVKLMCKIANGYHEINPNEGLKWAEKELALAQKIGWRKGENWAYNDFGANYHSKGDFSQALDAYFKALKIIEGLGDKGRIGEVSNNIGNVYLRLKNYPKALEYLFKALKIAEELGNITDVEVALGNIGGVYVAQGKHKEALEYMLKALKIAEEQGDQNDRMIYIGNIGAIYMELREYGLAVAYEYKSLRLAEEIGNKAGIAINLGNMGEAYLAIAKDSAVIKPDSLVPAGSAANLAKGIEYLNKAIDASKEMHYNVAIEEFSQYLSEAYALQGNYKGALQAFQQYTALKDSLYNTENSQKITNLETKRAVELKDKDIQIAKLKKRNERILSVAGFAVLLLIMGILFRNYRKQQHSNHLLTKEKKRSDDLLLNILPAEVAEELKESGGAHAKQYEEVSVLFTDFVNFTRIGEQLSAQQLVQELHECFTAFDTIVYRNGLEKIKTIGDAYMAVCGLPVADARHAQRTVQAAIEIRDFIEERKKRERVFEIRIGINSGPVVAGIVGVKKFAYDIWGDTVNIAARMQQHGEAGRINVTGSTYELVKDEFACIPRGKITAKHKGEVEMYFVEELVAELVEA